MKPQAAVAGTSTWRKVSCILCYVLCSTCLMFFNKATLSSFKFNYIITITFMQLVVAWFLLAAMRAVGLIPSFLKQGVGLAGAAGGKSLLGDSRSNSGVTLKTMENGGSATSAGAAGAAAPPILVPLSALQSAWPLSCTFLLNLMVSLWSMQFVSLPMFTTLRQTCAAMTLLVDKAVMKKRHGWGVVVSIATMCVGCLIAGVRDLEFDSKGYSAVMLANLCTTFYLVVIGRMGQTNLNTFGMIFSNATISTPLLAVALFATGEIWRVAHHPLLTNEVFLTVMLGSCVLAVLLNYATYLNTAVNGALTQSVCGNVKDVFIVAGGYLLFGNSSYDPINVMGVGITLAGSILYGSLKLRTPSGSSSSK